MTNDDRIAQSMLALRAEAERLGYRRAGVRGDNELELRREPEMGGRARGMGGEMRGVRIRFNTNQIHGEGRALLDITKIRTGGEQTGRGQGWGDGGKHREIRIVGGDGWEDELEAALRQLRDITRRALAVKP